MRSTRASRAPRVQEPRAAGGTIDLERFDFAAVYRATGIERVRLVKAGVPARIVEGLARRMHMPKERLFATLGMGRATIDRKARESQPLSRDEGSKLLGIWRLIGQVQAMVEDGGTAAGFDPAQWVSTWLEQPLPALDGRRPAEFMDTPEGQQLVASLVERMGAGAYA